MIQHQTESGVSPVIGVLLLTAIILSVISVATISTFTFLDESYTDKPDVELYFDEVGSDSIEVVLTEKQRADFVRIRMPDGREFELSSGGDSTGKKQINSEGYIRAITYLESGQQDIVRTYRPENYREISGLVFLNPPADNIQVEIQKPSGITDDSTHTDELGQFTLLPTDYTQYNINIGDAENVMTGIDTGDKSITVDIQDDIVNAGKSDSDTVAGFVMDGAGTTSNPYVVDSVSDLQSISTEKDATYEIKDDIDAGVTTESAWGGGFSEIQQFNGTLIATKDVQISGIAMQAVNGTIFEDTDPSLIENSSITATAPNGDTVTVVSPKD